ncbi:DUF2059 domain-containing protein [Erythrobacter aureus]|uniref:DUF2059 domain-containing protein n=1 Tax=Erythrobacter aureus TaxID=2182384 RepID=UPI003A8EC2BF
MMKKWMLAIAAPLALIGQPAVADEKEDAKAHKQAEAIAMIAEMFPAEPLTPEQQARLPLAASLIEQIMPDGTMDEIMESMFDGMLGPIMDLADQAGPSLSTFIGYDETELELDDEAVAEIAAIIDPEWRERQRRTMDLTKVMMGQLMTAMEPAMKRGMAEAYAANFTQAELEGIFAFFSTQVGATYARKSYQLTSDPRIMHAAMSELPKMVATFEEMGQNMKAEMADLPEKRDFEALGATERQRILSLTGLTEEDLRVGMRQVAEQDAKDAPF